jgi:hypothetical protein
MSGIEVTWVLKSENMKLLNRKTMIDTIIKYLYLILTAFLYWSCNPDKSVYNIKDGSIIKIAGQYGEIQLNLEDSSMMFSQISIFNKSGDLIYSQNIGNDGLIIGSINKAQDDSIYMRRFNSYFPEKEIVPINDTLVEKVYYDVYATRELVSNGRILYLEMYKNQVKDSNVLNFRLLDYEWIDDSRVKLLIRNYFPFSGDFNFFYKKTSKKVEARKVDQNLYILEFYVKKDSDKVLFDVEILPSNIDTLLRDVFTQQIIIEK